MSRRRRRTQWLKVDGERLRGLHYWSALSDGRILADTNIQLPGPNQVLDERHEAALTRPGPFAGAPEGSSVEVELEIHGLYGIRDFIERRFVSFASAWIRDDGPVHRRIDRYIIWPAGTTLADLNRDQLGYYRRLARVEQSWNDNGTHLSGEI